MRSGVGSGMVLGLSVPHSLNRGWGVGVGGGERIFRAAVGLKGVCEGDAERPWRLMVNINLRLTHDLMNGVCEFRKQIGNRSGSGAPVPDPMTFRPELTPFTRYRGVKI